jgi:predicted transcriptional regulator
LATYAYDWQPLSEEDMKAIEEGLRDYTAGKFYTEKEVWGNLEKE